MFVSKLNRRPRGTLLSALLGLGVTACVGAAPPPLPVDDNPESPRESTVVRAAEPIPGRYIVVLTEGHSARPREGVLAASGDLMTAYAATAVSYFDTAVEGFVADMTPEAAELLSQDARVAFVEEDGWVHASASQQINQNALFGLDRVDQRNLPLDRVYNFNTTGAGVTAFVLDTGIRPSHAEFGGRVVEGRTFINDGNGTNDCNGHGTHVAGTIGGATFGLAKAVTLVPVRVLGCDGSGSISGIIGGLDFAAQSPRRPAVANLSLGGGASQALDTAVRRATAAGVTVVVAAGNETADACGGSPSRAPEAITVGATTSADRRAGFSNFGNCVDIFAPGQGILSAAPTSDNATAVLSGTSMAAPHVAGAAALFLESAPSSTPAQVDAALAGNATPNLVVDARSAANKLLFIGFINGGGQPPGEEPPPEEEPTEGTPRTGAAEGSLIKDEVDRFQPQPVLAGTAIRVTMTGTGDADLYLRFNAAPSLTRFACRPFKQGSNEVCEGTVPAGATDFQLMVVGFAAATYEIDAEWTEP
jgi:serine protease